MLSQCIHVSYYFPPLNDVGIITPAEEETERHGGQVTCQKAKKSKNIFECLYVLGHYHCCTLQRKKLRH